MNPGTSDAVLGTRKILIPTNVVEAENQIREAFPLPYYVVFSSNRFLHLSWKQGSKEVRWFWDLKSQQFKLQISDSSTLQLQNFKGQTAYETYSRTPGYYQELWR